MKNSNGGAVKYKMYNHILFSNKRVLADPLIKTW